MKTRFLLGATLLIQALLVWVGYGPFITHPAAHAFVSADDGLKNNYTLYSYVQQPADTALWRFTGMNYPFGEGILYTDNIPLLASSLKLLGHYIPAIKQEPLAALNLLLPINFLVVTLLLFLVLKRFVKSWYLLLILPVAIPWLHPMGSQLTGPSSLAISLVVMLHFYLLLKWQEAGTRLAVWLWGVVLVMDMYLSFFVHGYYLFILAFTTGFFCVFTGLRLQKLRAFIAALVLPAAAIGLAAVTLNWLDTELLNRSNQVMGYNWDYWQLNANQLFVPGNLMGLLGEFTNHPEWQVGRTYPGGAFWLGLLVLLVAFIIARKPLAGSNLFKREWAPVLVIGLTALAMGSMAFGEDFYIFHSGFHVYNYFNPVLYLRRFIPQLNHLRFAERYFYPACFMGWVVWAFLLDSWLQQSGSRLVKNGMVTVLLLLLAAETLYQLKLTLVFTNTLESGYFEFATDLKPPPAQEYQAILPVPYFHIGSEEAGYTMETDEGFFNLTLSLAAETKLPLMSCKLSRTPEYQSRALITMLATGIVPKIIRAKLNTKPVLVIYNKHKDFANCTDCIKQKEGPSVEAFKNGFNFITMHNGKLLQENDNFAFYSITLK